MPATAGWRIWLLFGPRLRLSMAIPSSPRVSLYEPDAHQFKASDQGKRRFRGRRVCREFPALGTGDDSWAGEARPSGGPPPALDPIRQSDCAPDAFMGAQAAISQPPIQPAANAANPRVRAWRGHDRQH